MKRSSSKHNVVRQACALIEAWVGITLSGAAPDRLRDFLERRAKALGFDDVVSYLSHIQHAAPSEPEPRRLINLVTNGLTAFWRDEPQLDALRQALRDQAKGRDLKQRPLSVWCAGCSTGEEPYTVSMIAREENLPVVTLGTDINTNSLARARQGSFDTWSLRRLASHRRQLYFTQQGAETWQVIDALRERVYFRQHNLMSPAPSAPTPEGWDVIMCRNVLIYFRGEATDEVLERFAKGLQPQGYLMFGSSEQVLQQAGAKRSPFRASRHGQGFVYRLNSAPPSPMLLNIHREDVFESPFEASFEPLSDASVADNLEEATLDLDADEAVAEFLNAAVEHMKRRARTHALACCEAAACYDPFVPETFFLMATLLRDQKAPERAAEAWRKTLFLQPMHWLAAFELAQLYEEQLDRARARLAYRQALEGLERVSTTLFAYGSLRRMFEEAQVHRDAIKNACRVALKRIDGTR